MAPSDGYLYNRSELLALFNDKKQTADKIGAKALYPNLEVDIKYDKDLLELMKFYTIYSTLFMTRRRRGVDLGDQPMIYLWNMSHTCTCVAVPNDLQMNVKRKHKELSDIECVQGEQCVQCVEQKRSGKRILESSY